MASFVAGHRRFTAWAVTCAAECRSLCSSSFILFSLSKWWAVLDSNQ